MQRDQPIFFFISLKPAAALIAQLNNNVFSNKMLFIHCTVYASFLQKINYDKLKKV